MAKQEITMESVAACLPLPEHPCDKPSISEYHILQKLGYCNRDRKPTRFELSAVRARLLTMRDSGHARIVSEGKPGQWGSPKWEKVNG